MTEDQLDNFSYMTSQQRAALSLLLINDVSVEGRLGYSFSRYPSLKHSNTGIKPLTRRRLELIVADFYKNALKLLFLHSCIIDRDLVQRSFVVVFNQLVCFCCKHRLIAELAQLLEPKNVIPFLNYPHFTEKLKIWRASLEALRKLTGPVSSTHALQLPAIR